MVKDVKEKIARIGKQRRISLHCPNCSYFGLIDIKGRTKVGKKTKYYVRCPKCGQNFKQIGRPYNFWRDVKKKYNLNHEQLHTIQKEFMRKVHQDGQIKARKRTNAIEIGDLVFIKHEDGDLKAIRVVRADPNKF
ncbi:MAG: hypothetical protein ABSB91_03795 [Sedimentisphaerales bacterium]|jgi:hypothetical protein